HAEDTHIEVQLPVHVWSKQEHVAEPARPRGRPGLRITTLGDPTDVAGAVELEGGVGRWHGAPLRPDVERVAVGIADPEAAVGCAFRRIDLLDPRSEEHTSELQSRGHLVCRLLTRKKKLRTPCDRDGVFRT